MKIKSIGERIKSLRKEFGLTQKQLGKRIGVSHVAISQWEKEETEPNGDNLLSLADALMCSPEYIIRGITKPDPAQNDSHIYSKLTKTEKILLEMFNDLPQKEKDNFMKAINTRKNELEQLYEEMKVVKERKTKEHRNAGKMAKK